ncbi:hypothetical protein CONPUDRAFT_139274 [Coniophora puteana RWD-64-598 SS2]|uniref:DUF7330 domain-containing protein n=1 Tax=Coniophora puteana (strain RWD-64-598) TaxID=741705 RepID=A0A5M3MDZ6_CONPW|nr:uncharacterized protein CONPUDRAFT_139274 [Coniophora puteana RWD-64-598 SS2]EIW77353.1 hypothetical protein CONPUDRAFT_139274 [Coniophora puteana RWD-64-598 SS2]
MIILGSKRQQDQATAPVQRAFDEMDAPPAYTSLGRATPIPVAIPTLPLDQTNPSSSHNPFYMPPAGVRPTNHLSLEKSDGRIEGSFCIDPSISLPAHLLPPLRGDETEGTRPNLRLRTKDGRIDASVYVQGSPIQNPGEALKSFKSRRIRVDMHTKDGSIYARLIPLVAHIPFTLTLYTADGRITLLLPRSFRGPLALTIRDGKAILSPGVLANAVPLGHQDRTSRYFVDDGDNNGNGDIAVWSGVSGDEGWTGDEVRAETRDGSVYVRYLDEEEEQLSVWQSLARMIGV